MSVRKDYHSFFSRTTADNASRVLAIVEVCPSVSLRYCAKNTQAKITKSLLWVAARTLVYRDKILCAWMRGFPLNEKKMYSPPQKMCLFYRYWLVYCVNGYR